jgi:hypothetical protein
MDETRPLLLDSITTADATAAGRVVVSGSHGGRYPAWLAARAGVRAIVLNDAGFGLEDAGVAGLAALGALGVAGAAADHGSARIGDAGDALARGRVSFANAPAAALGVVAGQPVTEAAARLAAAPVVDATGFSAEEARALVPLGAEGTEAVLIDSVALLQPADAGRIVVTGCHGGLVGGRPESAASVAAAVLVFSDAGVGRDEAGLSRLPVLAERGIAAVTVAHDSARIGDARSVFETGRVSHANGRALGLGITPGLPLHACLRRAATALAI